MSRATRITSKRRAVLGAVLALAAAVALTPGNATSAEGDEEGDAPIGEMLLEPAILASETEARAYELLASDKLLTARTLAEQALAENPDAILGNFVFGVVLYQAEGLLPKAMVHLLASRRAFERLYGEIPTGGARQTFHRLLLQSTQGVAGEMEQFEEQLRIIDRYDALYDPDLSGERAWALLQLRRFDEARAAAERGAESGDAWERSISLNSLCAIESELRTREAQYRACMGSFEDSHGEGNPRALEAGEERRDVASLSVDAVNAASAAHSVLRFDEVERLLLLATKSPEPGVANPWRALTSLYTDEGRLSEAVTAAREMLRWRMRLAAGLRDQDRAGTDGVLAELLLAFGEAEAGHRLISRAIQKPDRRGLISSKHEVAAGAFALLRRSLAKVRGEIAAEKASASGLGGRVKGAASAARSLADRSVDDARIVAILADETTLRSTLRVYLSGGIEAPTWLLGDLVDILGAGVVGAELDLVRAEEASLGEAADFSAYYDAIEAEVALARGRLARAAELSRGALERLPPAEALLKARVAAIFAAALSGAGDRRGAMILYQRALEMDAGVFRRLGLSIPAIIRDEGGPGSAKAASLLAGSPRLREERDGFLVVIDSSGASLRACLRSPDGASLACAEEAPKAGATEDDLASRLVMAFHANAFAARVTLTSGDLRSLDGSTTLAGQAQRERMEELLREMAKDPSGER